MWRVGDSQLEKKWFVGLRKGVANVGVDPTSPQPYTCSTAVHLHTSPPHRPPPPPSPTSNLQNKQFNHYSLPSSLFGDPFVLPSGALLEAWTWGRFTSFQHASALGHGNLLAGMLAQLCFAPFAKVSAAIRRSKEPRWDPDPSL